jgi:hypothetical protein
VVAHLRRARELRIARTMRAFAILVWMVIGLPVAAWVSWRARRRLRHASGGRGPLTLQRIA